MNLLISTVYSLLVTACIFLIIVCLYAYIVWIEHRKYAHLPGPPLDSFFLGHLTSIRRAHKNGKYHHFIFLDWAEKYRPVYKIFVFHKVLVIPTEPLLFKELLTRSKYPKSRLPYRVVTHVFGSRFFGNGLVTNFNHSSWFARRMALNPAFHKRFLAGLANSIIDLSDRWIDKLSTFADGNTHVIMADSFGRFTLDLVTKLVFKMDMNSINEENCPLYSALNKVIEGMSAQNKDPVLQYKPHKRAFVKDVREAIAYIRDVGRHVITGRLEALKRGQSFGDDILSYLVHVPDGDAWKPTFDDVVDDFVTILVAEVEKCANLGVHQLGDFSHACHINSLVRNQSIQNSRHTTQSILDAESYLSNEGQETSANILTFAVSELGKHPKVLTKVEDELDEVFGHQNDITFDQIGKLKYMEMVLKETLRLYPTAPGTGRENLEDIHFGDYRIPANSFLVCSFFVSHRLSTNFEHPNEFIPERFEHSKTRLPYTFMPFSLGMRSCLGKEFAMIQMKILLSKFIRRFHFSVDCSQSLDINEVMSLRLKGGCPITLTLKKSNVINV